MPKHINKRGQPGECRAVKACPFGGEQRHCESVEEIYSLIEREQTIALRGEPTFTLDEVPVNENSVYTLDPHAQLESKNKGEFAELYVAHSILSDHRLKFAPGSTTWTPRSLRVGVNDYKRVPEGWYVETANKDVSFLHLKEAEVSSENVFVDIKSANTRRRAEDENQATGNSYISTPTIQQAAVNLGFTDGKVPKAPSNLKADLIAWDKRGHTKRISIKSYLSGSATPAILSVSNSGSINYSAKRPEGMTDDEVIDIIFEANNKTASADALAVLKKHGITFSPQESSAHNPQLARNLKRVHPQAMEAYSTRLLASASKSTKWSKDLDQAYKATLTAFATRMTPQTLSPKSESITDFMTVHGNGEIEVRNFKSNEALEEYVSDRSDITTGGKTTVAYENGEFILNLKAQAGFSKNKKTTK